MSGEKRLIGVTLHLEAPDKVRLTINYAYRTDAKHGSVGATSYYLTIPKLVSLLTRLGAMGEEILEKVRKGE